MEFHEMQIRRDIIIQRETVQVLSETLAGYHEYNRVL